MSEILAYATKLEDLIIIPLYRTGDVSKKKTKRKIEEPETNIDKKRKKKKIS